MSLAVITSIWDSSWLSRSFVPIVQEAETGERVRNLAGGKIEAHSTLLADRGKPGATETIAPRARCEGLVSIVASPVSLVNVITI